MSVYEVNFDGLVGPSHHYAGLSKGNIASQKNAMAAANPKAAALQGLLFDKGSLQCVWLLWRAETLESCYRLVGDRTDRQNA